MRQVFDSLLERSTYHFLQLPALHPVAGRVLDEAASPLLFLLWSARLAYSQVGFYKKVLIHLSK